MSMSELERLKKEDLMDGLFGISKDKKTVSVMLKEIPLTELLPSPRNHFRVENDDAMEELSASVREKGILEPFLVREQDGGGYEILSGHRRRHAAIRAELQTVPCIIKKVSDEDRDIIVADSNLQRPYITPSEKAWAIRIKYDAIKRKQGQKSEIESKKVPGALLNSAQTIAEKMGLAEKTIKRYVRLTYLIEPLQKWVDEKRLPLKAGVQLSYLPEKIQQYLYHTMNAENIKVNEEKAEELRRSLADATTMDEVFQAIKPNPAAQKKTKLRTEVKVNKNLQRRFFPPDYDEEQIQQVILGLLDGWAIEHNPDYKNEKISG
ncbi:MAG: ParB/RepB/Spo0J family partition protein [Clostridia bacterium]